MKNEKKLEKILAWQLSNVRNKNEVVEEARNESTFCVIDGSLELELQHQK